MFRDFGSGEILGVTDKEFKLELGYGQIKGLPTNIDIHKLKKEKEINYPLNANCEIILKNTDVNKLMYTCNSKHVYDIKLITFIKINGMTYPVEIKINHLWVKFDDDSSTHDIRLTTSVFTIMNIKLFTD